MPLLCCAVGVRVVNQPEDQFVNVNDTLRLICDVSGSEPISYQWLTDGGQLQDDGRVSGSSTSVLMVDPVEGGDFGGYRCNASNEVDQMLSNVSMVASECVHCGVRDTHVVTSHFCNDVMVFLTSICVPCPLSLPTSFLGPPHLCSCSSDCEPHSQSLHGSPPGHDPQFDL